MGNSNVAEATNPRQAQFKVFSGALTPFDGKADGRKRLRTIASSSVEDLGGDVITAEALKKMAASAVGKTVFRNHTYKVPDDILGSIEAADVKYAGTDDIGKPVWDLVLDVLVRNDQKSMETFEAIESGVRLGTSIGAMIPAGGARKGDKGGYIFDDLGFLEASIVGIPQNPRSFVEYATKAFKVFEAEDEADEDEVNEGFHAVEDPGDGVEKTGVEVPSDGEVRAVTLEPAEQVDKDAEPDVEKAKVWVSHDQKGNHSVVVDTDAAMTSPEPDTSKAKAKKKDVEPEVVKDHDENEALDASIDWANLPEGDQDAADALYAELDALKDEEPDLIKSPLSSAARSNLKDSQFACPEKRKYPIQDKAHIRNALARCGDPSNDQCGCGKVRAAAKAAGISQAAKAIEPMLTLDADLESDPTADSEEPAEDSPAQELEKSVPESAQPDAFLNDTMAKGADVLADLVKSLTKEVLATREERDGANAARDEAIQKAKDATTNAEYAIGLVVELANRPFGPKALVAEAAVAAKELRTRFGGIYSADILKMLENTDDA